MCVLACCEVVDKVGAYGECQLSTPLQTETLILSKVWSLRIKLLCSPYTHTHTNLTLFFCKCHSICSRGRAVSNTASQGDGVPLLLWCTGVATTPGWAAYVHLMDHRGQEEGPSEHLWFVWTYRWIFVCSGACSPQFQNKSLRWTFIAACTGISRLIQDPGIENWKCVMEGDPIGFVDFSKVSGF